MTEGDSIVSGLWSKVMVIAMGAILVTAIGAIVRVEVLSGSVEALRKSNEGIRDQLKESPTRGDVELIVENRAQRLFIDLNDKMQKRFDEMEAKIEKRIDAIKRD